MAELEYTQYGDRMLVEDGLYREFIDIVFAHIKMIIGCC